MNHLLCGATSPRGGEVNANHLLSETFYFVVPHPPGSLRERGDLPTRWGGEYRRGRLMNDLPSEPFCFVAPHPPGSLRELGDLPTRWGGEQLRSLSLAL